MLNPYDFSRPIRLNSFSHPTSTAPTAVSGDFNLEVITNASGTGSQ
jgi:hypothetical protein